MAFYGTAMITFLITCAWLLLVADEPGKHPRITPKERSYIEQSLGGNVSKKKVITNVLGEHVLLFDVISLSSCVFTALII